MLKILNPPHFSGQFKIIKEIYRSPSYATYQYTINVIKMILSKKYLFIFVKGKKVAGTSVEVLLSSICGPEDIITPITPIDEKYRIQCGYRCAQNYGAIDEEHNRYINSVSNFDKNEMINIKHPKGLYYNHMPFTKIIDTYGDITKEWIVFAVERSPYYKIISLANMQLNFKNYKKSGKTMESSIDNLKLKISEMIKNKKIENVKNIDLYKDCNGNIKTHFLRFEKIHEDIEKMMVKINVKKHPNIPHLKKGMNVNSIDLHDIFSKEQLKIINEIFHQEFDLYGYKMIF